MAQLSYPGVYVEEIPSGVHTITGVPTSVAAFVGYTARGLENRATQIFSWADFERGFGGLAIDSELGYAVQGFFANGGGQAYIVRVPRKGAKSANAVIKNATANALTLTAISSGPWGNAIVADIDYDGIPTTSTTAFNMTLTDTASGVSERFPGLSIASGDASYVNAVINDPDGGSQLVTAAALAAPRPVRSGTITKHINYGGFSWVATTNYGLTISSAVIAPAVNVLIVPAGATPPGSLVEMARLIEVRVNAALSSIRGAAIRCEVTPAQELKFTANHDPSLWAGTQDDILTVAPPPTTGLNPPLSMIFGLTTAVTDIATAASRFRLGGHTGGGVASVIVGDIGTALPGTAELVGDQLAASGIYALDKFDFNLLAIPDATRSLPGQPDVKDTTVDANLIFGPAMAFCQYKRAFLMMDTPPDVSSVDKAVDWRTNRNTVRGNNGAMYFPRLRVADPLNDYKLRTVAPCGIAAGLYARTDGARGVWKAPAGIDAYLNGVSAPAVILSDAENGMLNPIGLNCFRSFPVYGNVAWGARTNEGADALGSEWKYIPVRRTALFIEESLYRGTKWAVFEPNDEGLWAQLRLNIGAFMQSLFVQGAFQGSDPKSAYLVKCDRTTTTQNDINNGVVNILVGFAPLKPAEFVVLQIQQMAGQIQT